MHKFIRLQKETTGLPVSNPTYESEATTLENLEVTDNSNSSLGPTYEQINSIGGNYDILNQRRAPRPHPPTTPPESHDPTSNQDYATLDNSTQEHYYHVLEIAKVKNECTSQDRDYSVLDINEKARLKTNQQDKDVTEILPQNYELPVSKDS